MLFKNKCDVARMAGETEVPPGATVELNGLDAVKAGMLTVYFEPSPVDQPRDPGPTDDIPEPPPPPVSKPKRRSRKAKGDDA